MWSRRISSSFIAISGPSQSSWRRLRLPCHGTAHCLPSILSKPNCRGAHSKATIRPLIRPIAGDAVSSQVPAGRQKRSRFFATTACSALP